MIRAVLLCCAVAGALQPPPMTAGVTGLGAESDFTLTREFTAFEASERFGELYEAGLETVRRRDERARALRTVLDERAAIDAVWPTICARGEEAAAASPVLAPALRRIVAHASLPAGLAENLAARLADGDVGRGPLAEALKSSLESSADALARDLLAIVDADPARPSPLTAFLHFKGFLALATHRAAAALWSNRGGDAGAEHLALYLQGRASSVFGVDIHPGATVGSGVFIDHGTGVVIGEQATVGDGCYLLHGVTLGATGKVKRGKRHPTVGAGVTLGSGASVLGPVIVGDGATVGANACVTKDVAAGATVIDTSFMNNRILAPRRK